MTEVVPPKAPIIAYNLLLEGNKIGEFSNEMELAMAAARYAAFNGKDNTSVEIMKDGVVVDELFNYWALKLPDIFIFANKTLAELNVLSAQVSDLQKKYKELKDGPAPVEAPKQ